MKEENAGVKTLIHCQIPPLFSREEVTERKNNNSKRIGQK